MSGKGKRSGKKHTQKSLGDVTLNDFANAKICTNRQKKSVDSVTRIMNQIKVDDSPWYEKVDDFDNLDFVEEENEDGSARMVMRKAESKRKKRSSETSVSETGVDYPIDIWFLISEFIRPEDVGRFACICKTTYAVVCSAKFWFGLYRRYYRSVPELPERLQPECMVRLYGLRACVIRALHYMYYDNQPLVHLKNQPMMLVNRQCILVWHKKCKDKWQYYFKMRDTSATVPPNRSRRNGYKPDLTEMLEDVFANHEEGCRILQVSCKHFISVPPAVIGQTLTSAWTKLSVGFGALRLHLEFGSGLRYPTRTVDVSSVTDIVLDPVSSVRVLDWWHPLYPHSQTTPLLNQD